MRSVTEWLDIVADAEAACPDRSATRFRELRNKAIDLLARREHSRVELVRKLRAANRRLDARQRDTPGSSDIPEDALEDASLPERVAEELAAEGLQSDARFCEVLVHSRTARGQGPLRIRSDLQRAGVCEAEIEIALDAIDLDWRQLARDVAARKFGESAPADHGQWARRARFLASRGFPESIVRAALRDFAAPD